jgi:membrane protein involved in colicin uptake
MISVKNIFKVRFVAVIVGLFLVSFGNIAFATVCGMYQGQQICTNSAQQWSQVTGHSAAEANAVQNQYNQQQAAAAAKAAQEAAAREAAYLQAQKIAAGIHAQNAQEQAALLAAQQRQRDQNALQQLAAQKAAQDAAAKAASSKASEAAAAQAAAAKALAAQQAAQQAAQALAAQQAAAQAALNYRTTLNNQFANQLTQSGAACNGYMQGGRCVPNNLVATNGGSPVNIMNPPESTWAGAGKRQTCTLVYKYVGGRVVGNAQTVCTIQ